MAKVLLAMSGGVDSSVAAHLLCREGHEVVGVFMRHGEQSPVACETSGSDLPIVSPKLHTKQGCCSAADALDAQRVADQLAIPFYSLNLQEEFSEIIDYFVAEYSSGRTPNPCIVCNNWLKFGKLFEYADTIGATHVATGHYARIDLDSNGDRCLFRGLDQRKDQSYVLFGVERALLDRMMLPIGGYRKDEIRAIAGEKGLGIADKPDSQEICFVSSGDHAKFVSDRRGSVGEPGEIITSDGHVVGHHSGIERFTIGQRRGVGVAMGEPYFVMNIDADTHQVTIGKKGDLARDDLYASRANWQAGERSDPFSCLAQIRYNSRAVEAVVEPLGDGRIHVRFEQPCYGIAPGQAVVCYEGDRVICGGWID